MNKKVIIFLVLLFSLAFLNGKDALIGTWKADGQVKADRVYIKVKDFENTTGFVFKDSGLMSITKSSWCCTGGCSYSTFNGLWKRLQDTIIMYYQVNYFRHSDGYIVVEKYKIMELADSSLTLQRIWLKQGSNFDWSKNIFHYKETDSIRDVKIFSREEWLSFDNIKEYKIIKPSLFTSYQFAEGILAGNIEGYTKSRKSRIDWNQENYWVIQRVFRTANRWQTYIIIMDIRDPNKMIFARK